MCGKDVCLTSVCVFVCQALRPQLYPSKLQSVFYRGLRFTRPREAGGFTSARKFQIRGKFPFRL